MLTIWLSLRRYRCAKPAVIDFSVARYLISVRQIGVDSGLVVLPLGGQSLEDSDHDLRRADVRASIRKARRFRPGGI